MEKSTDVGIEEELVCYACESKKTACPCDVDDVFRILPVLEDKGLVSNWTAKIGDEPDSNEDNIEGENQFIWFDLFPHPVEEKNKKSYKDNRNRKEISSLCWKAGIVNPLSKLFGWITIAF